jgi:hypothetical protein
MRDEPAAPGQEGDLPSSVTALFESFRNPPKSASINPFWFWQGKLDLDTLTRQMHAMVEQGVMCAIVHNRSGLRTPYLSDQYFSIVRGLLEEAARIGFQVNFVDEFNWPSGQGWDIWRPQALNRVLEKNPEARLKGIQVDRVVLDAGERCAWDPQSAWLGASIVEWDRATETISDRVVAVFDCDTAVTELIVPDGASWLVLRYSLAEVVGVDGSLVDLLNPDAVATFLQEVHALYEEKVGDYFGNVLGLFYLDHEGDYGGRIPWTKHLPAEFQRRKGYHVLECLPYLLYESPTLAGSRRFAFLDVISDLYVEHFWGQIARWCEARNLQLTGHAWEESLWNEAAFTGSLFRVQRALPLPGVDSLLNRGLSPREIKESASVAHFESRGLSVENQAVLGIDSYLDPERMKIATNTLAVWGTTMFIPHAFNYNPARVDWPEDWFLHQPYWPYFHHYALYTQRLAFMNTQGRHSVRVLLYAPLETAWAESRRVFNAVDYPEYRIDLPWGTAMDEVEQVYSALMDGLVATQIDYDVADWEYVQRGRLEGHHLAIGPEQYQAIVLPPMTYMSLETAHTLLTWAWAGGIIIAVGRRPTASVEFGIGDPGLREAMHDLFEAPGAPGILVDDAKKDTLVERVAAVLDQKVGRDFRVTGPLGPAIRYSRRTVGSCDVFLVVNDSDQEGEAWVRCDVRGRVQRWRPDTGQREDVLAEPVEPTATRVHCRFEPWGAFYLVFDRADTGGPAAQVEIPGRRERAEQPAAAVHVEAKGLGGSWRFKPEHEVPAPYAREQSTASLEEGERRGWALPGYNDRFWPRTWISRERLTIRNVWTAGPYPNDNHRGCISAAAPEDAYLANPSDPRLHRHDLPDGKSWRFVGSPGRIVDLDSAFATRKQPWISGYALAYIEAPERISAQIIVVADNNVKLWLNGKLIVEYHDHPFYIEMREGFGITQPVELLPGTNTILLKVSKGIHTPTGQLGFTLRLGQEDGQPLTTVVNVKEPGDRSEKGNDRWTWYRLDVPAGATLARIPWTTGMRAYADGIQIEPGDTGILALPDHTRLLTLAYPPGHVLTDYLHFRCDWSSTPLGSIIGTAFEYYCGPMLYERSVTLTSNEVATDWELDLGMVGSVAEVHVNGHKVGERPWQPYRVPIGSHLQAGENIIQVRVVNTRAASRAVGDSGRLPYFETGPTTGPELLNALERNGLLGPVEMRPYVDSVVSLP